MRLEWIGVAAMSLLLNSQTPASRSILGPAQKPPDFPEVPPGAVTQAGPTDCLSYRIEEDHDTGTTTVTCIFGGPGGFTFPYGGGGGGGGGVTSPGGGGGGGGTLPGTPLAGDLQFRVNSAKSTALQKLNNRPQCAALFAGYTAPWNSGSWILGFVTYRNGEGTARCTSGTPLAAAWTTIPTNPAETGHPNFIVACRSFGTLTVGEAANTLIHEALHVAGHRERPPDTTGMTTGEIQQMVREACGS